MKNNALFIFIFFSVITSCSNPVSEEKKETPKFFHDVYFYLAEDVTQAQRSQFLTGLKELGEVPSLIDYHIGVPAGTPRTVVDGTYDYSIITSFTDKEGQDAYQIHPIHEKFKELTVGIVDSVRIYDSIIQ